MQVQVDKFGRVVIPKSMRDHLGIKSGTVIFLEERVHDIVLKVAEPEPQIIMKGGVAVYVSEASGDVDSVVQAGRDERLDKLGGK